MRAQIPLAIFALLLGTLQIAGAVQELVVRGILQSLTGPLCIGAIGTLGGFLTLFTGIALLLSSQRIAVLIQATAWINVPFFVLAGVVYHFVGWPMTALGIAFPLVLVLLYLKSAKPTPQPA